MLEIYVSKSLRRVQMVLTATHTGGLQELPRHLAARVIGGVPRERKHCRAEEKKSRTRSNRKERNWYKVRSRRRGRIEVVNFPFPYVYGNVRQLFLSGSRLPCTSNRPRAIRAPAEGNVT